VSAQLWIVVAGLAAVIVAVGLGEAVQRLRAARRD